MTPYSGAGMLCLYAARFQNDRKVVPGKPTSIIGEQFLNRPEMRFVGAGLDNILESAVKKKWRKILPYALLALAAILIVANSTPDELRFLLEKSGNFGLVICLFAYLLLGLTPIPTALITLFVATWKGPIAATILASAGSTLSACVDYYVGGSISVPSDFEKKKEMLPFHLGCLPMDSPEFLLFARMLPAFGPKFTGIVSGMFKVPLLTYLWTTLAVNLLGAALLAFGGFGIIRLFR
jgi:uncharacterized membrane protein YdjX (TVP38/TMEM64 family)